MDCYTVASSHPTSFLDDEIAALTLQLEEIGIYSEAGKGKYAVGNPPDIELAYGSFQAELQSYRAFRADQDLARSIGAAVYSDGPAIADLTAQEVQSHEDRLFALQTSNTDPEYEKPGTVANQAVSKLVDEWMTAATESQYAGSVVDFSDNGEDTEVEAGPSRSYAERQADAMKKLSKQSKCAVCHEYSMSGLTIHLPCNDRYCVDCLKELFTQATRDETLLPLRCHKQPIPLQLIARHLSADELAAYERANVEVSTADRTYCSNLECGIFILPEQIEPGTHRAVCDRCDTATCGMCKNSYHHDLDCPDDPALRETRRIAAESGWKSCYHCGRIVSLRTGCNHITCVCKAQFCYVCGEKWKTCRCDVADINRIEERAEEVVDRDAGEVLPPVERQRRVARVRNELEQNHECEHPGRFQKLWRHDGYGGRRGFQCEMCYDRHWKYILQCRHCFVNVCEECRRHRI
ncbi:hypothetical protein PMIN06_003134 [Paraphaeosphaeria minitans]